jgi:hypothetical protein
MIDQWLRENFVVWPPYHAKIGLSELDLWFFWGVNNGATYEVHDIDEFREKGHLYDAWKREYETVIAQISEPRWIPERTNQTAGPRGKLP